MLGLVSQDTAVPSESNSLEFAQPASFGNSHAGPHWHLAFYELGKVIGCTVLPDLQANRLRERYLVACLHAV